MTERAGARRAPVWAQELKQHAETLAARIPWIRLLRVAVFALAIFHVVLFLGTVAMRIGYPFELEWTEGGIEDYVRRVLAGEPIYTAPSMEFGTSIYTPLYFYLAALPARLFGLSFVPLRVVSLLATLASALLIYALVRSGGGRRSPAALAAMLFIGAFEAAGTWFDLAKIDMVFLALLLASFYAIHASRSARGYALAGLILLLAFLTKQTALIAGMPLVVWALWRDRWRAVPLVVMALGGIVVTTLLFDRLTDGWYSFYVFELPSRHPFLPFRFVSFWTADFFGSIGLAVVVGLTFLWIRRYLGRPYSFWAIAWAAAVLTAYAGRIHEGGCVNAVIPAFALTAVLFGLGFDAVERCAESLSQKRIKQGVRGLLYVATLVQLIVLLYIPMWHIPSAADEAAGRRIVSFLAEAESPVYVPSHGYLAQRAGHEPGAHSAAHWDLLRGDFPARDTLMAVMREALRSQRYSLIIESDADLFRLPLGSTYVEVDRLFDDDTEFFPVAGGRMRPLHVYIPRPISEPDTNATPSRP
ncbi:MAG: glycosyltransferase family 39 protein [Bacteroidetes bacterium]|nr:glycosyltransferase family 39 protein [Bacteroidota bacterium]